MKVVESITASRCIYRRKEDHTSVGHRVHVKPVLEVSWFYFPAVLMTRLNVTFSFWQILKIDMIKAQLLWILLRPFIAGIYAFSQRIGKKMHDIHFFLINWHDRVGESSNPQNHFMFFKNVLKDGPGNKWLAANWFIYLPNIPSNWGLKYFLL